MTPTRFMVIAGETSGDILAAELVRELRAAVGRADTYSPNVQPVRADLAPRFFGAGGPRMAAAGVELAVDMTQHAVIGLPGPRDFFKFRRLLNDMVALAVKREPHVIICVDFALFNALFAKAVKRHVHARRGSFNNWQPKIIKYISPQVWASRERRAYDIARDFDLLLSIFPFEKSWYAARVPQLPVEYVGHPMIDRHANSEPGTRTPSTDSSANPSIVLLPGSRPAELKRHLPVILGACKLIQAQFPGLRGRIVLPNELLFGLLPAYQAVMPNNVTATVGGLAEALRGADLAMASTGTVTMECAYFGVPAVAFYKTSWLTYEIGKRIVKVKSLTMPNLLANETVFPEFVQHTATAGNIAAASLALLRDPARRAAIRARLFDVIQSLGGPGASRRAAEAILRTSSLHNGQV